MFLSFSRSKGRLLQNPEKLALATEGASVSMEVAQAQEEPFESCSSRREGPPTSAQEPAAPEPQQAFLVDNRAFKARAARGLRKSRGDVLMGFDAASVRRTPTVSATELLLI